MKILLMNQFFWPDSAATSQLLTDLAIGMAERGHTVDVICAQGSYAVASSEDRPAVEIHRIPSLPFSRGKLGRIFSYLSFYTGAALRALTLPRPDLVVTLTTPPLLSLLGTLLKRVRGTRHVIWEMDVYPDVAVGLGYFKQGGVLDLYVGLLADSSRKQADGILALGECMKSLLVSRGMDHDKVMVAENWADGQEVTPVRRPGTEDRLTVLYSGNFGLAHDAETITGAMLELKHSERFNFIFAGGGSRRQELEALCKRENLTSARFQTYVERSSLGQSLGEGDIGLVTQQESCCGAVVPSKIYGLLAAGRPILFIGPAEATPARLIRRYGCGWHVDCGDVSSLVHLLHALSTNREAVRTAGEKARHLLLAHYDRPIGVARICSLLGVFQSSPAEAQTGALEASDSNAVAMSTAGD